MEKTDKDAAAFVAENCARVVMTPTRWQLSAVAVKPVIIAWYYRNE